MAITSPLKAIKQTVGRTVGAVGGVLNSQALRDVGGQITGGLRTYNIFNPPSAKAEVLGSQYDPYANAKSTQGYANPTPPSTNQTYTPSGSAGGNAGTLYDQGMGNIQGQLDTGNDLIEQDYSNSISQLDAQAGQLQSEAGAASGQIESNAASTKNQIANQQAIEEQGVQSQLSTGETGAKTAMQQARDLFRQTQGQNIAQLSALGISSSSVAEALAERLGVETARRIAGVTGSIQEVRQNATKELARVKNYYTGKMTDLQNWVSDQKANIQNALLTGLNQINAAKNQAASDKARGRAELLANVQNSIYSLTQQYNQFKQSLDLWNAQKASALTPVATDPKFVQSLANATNTFNQQFAPAGFSYVPEFSTDPYGSVKGNINYNLQKKGTGINKEDIYNQAGI